MKKCVIYYHTLTDEMRKKEKLDWFTENKIKNIPFDHIQPDKNHNWINLSEVNDWENLLPLAEKNVKLKKNKKAIFNLSSNGVVTARDEWVYDFNKENLKNKLTFFLERYNYQLNSGIYANNDLNYEIKWSESLKSSLKLNKTTEYRNNKIVNAFYRPYIGKFYFFDNILSDRLTQRHFDIYGSEGIYNNNVILINQGSTKFKCIVTKNIFEFGSMLEAGGQTIGFPLFVYGINSNRIDNITNWGLKQFKDRYLDKKIKRIDIFHYVYAVLHNPIYRKKYELNLKREFPRIPFYNDFWRWAEWGENLMDLHINFETVEPFPLERIDLPWDKERTPKAKLSRDKEYGIITLDEQTLLKNIPKEVWEYKLGNRSAIEWILDQYKEKTPRDPTIREKFNTYKFSDYKEKVIDLIKRVTTVSVETMKIIKEMEVEK